MRTFVAVREDSFAKAKEVPRLRYLNNAMRHSFSIPTQISLQRQISYAESRVEAPMTSTCAILMRKYGEEASRSDGIQDGKVRRNIDAKRTAHFRLPAHQSKFNSR